MKSNTLLRCPTHKAVVGIHVRVFVCVPHESGAMDFRALSNVWYFEEHEFSKIDLFPSSIEGGQGYVLC
jgi:hypothetical protein